MASTPRKKAPASRGAGSNRSTSNSSRSNSSTAAKGKTSPAGSRGTTARSSNLKNAPKRKTSARKSSSLETSPREMLAPRTGKKSLWKIVVLLSSAGVLLPVIALIGFLDGYGQIDRAQKADAIVVLGAQVRADGTAGIALRLRALHALQLYKKGVASHIICTGGVGTNPPAEAVAAAQLLLTKGVPREAIFLEKKSTSTWENAAFAARICKTHGWKSVVIASDPFHLWRASRNFQKQGLRVYVSPVAREKWSTQPLLKIYWTSREALLVIRDWLQRRV